MEILEWKHREHQEIMKYISLESYRIKWSLMTQAGSLCLRPVYSVHLQAKDILCDYQTGVLQNSPKMVLLFHLVEESVKLGDKILVFR